MTLVAGPSIAADTIVMRELKGSPLSTADFDWDLTTLMGGINAFDGEITDLEAEIAAIKIDIIDLYAAIAALGGGIGTTSYVMTAGQYILTVGTDLKSNALEIVFLGASAAENLERINGAANGNIKVFIATANNVTVVRDDSYIKTKNTLSDPNLEMEAGDVIALVNVGGIAGTSTNGTWLEIFRALQV